MAEKPTTSDFRQTFGAKEPQPILQLKKFGIMALLTEKNNELHFVLTKSAAHVRQPGDICFPGGHQEKGENLKPLCGKQRKKSAFLRNKSRF